MVCGPSLVQLSAEFAHLVWTALIKHKFRQQRVLLDIITLVAALPVRYVQTVTNVTTVRL